MFQVSASTVCGTAFSQSTSQERDVVMILENILFISLVTLRFLKSSANQPSL